MGKQQIDHTEKEMGNIRKQQKIIEEKKSRLQSPVHPPQVVKPIH